MLLAPLRRRHRHGASLLLPQPGFQLLRRAFRQRLAQDVPRDQARLLIILGGKGGDHLARVLPALPGQGEMISSDHPPAAHIKDLDHRVQPVLRHCDQVLLAPVGPQGDLSFHQAFHVADPVADLRCLLVAHGRRRFLHVLLQPPDHHRVVAAQETQDALHHFPVGFLRAQARAGRQTAADVVVHAGALRVLRRQRLAAGADREDVPHGLDHLPDRVRADIRPEILRAVLLHPAAQLQPGKRLAQVNLQVGIVFVILEQDVVIRFVLLDQVAFQDQGFQVRFAQEDVEIVDMGDHGRYLRRMGRVPEIAPDPVFQVHRLADVDDRPGSVLHQITAGGIRQHPDLLLQLLTPVGHRRLPFRG